MSYFREVARCKRCGKIYSNGIPIFCEKCGVKLGEKFQINQFHTSYFCDMMYKMTKGKLKLTDNCEKIVAKRKLFRWEIKEDED